MRLTLPIGAILLTLLAPLHAAETTLGLIQLHHRSAQEIAPLVKPFLLEGGAVSGMGDHLVVRTTPENLHDIEQLVKELDRAPRRLLITVRQGVTRDEAAHMNELYGGVTGSDGGIRAYSAGRGVGGVRAEVRSGDLHAGTRYYATASREQEANTQRIQTLEGHAARISVGKSFPVVKEYSKDNGGESATLDYKEVNIGFTVLPRVNGEQVTLNIVPERNVLSPRGNGEIDTQRLESTITGRLGEWLELGGALRAGAHTGSGTTYSTADRGEQHRSVWVMVEELGE